MFQYFEIADCRLQFATCILQFAVCNVQLAELKCVWQCAVSGLQFAVRGLIFQFQVKACLCDVDLDFDVLSFILHLAICILQLASCILEIAACRLRWLVFIFSVSVLDFN